ncbi:MAG TPA: hypothetical protein VM756_00160 [Burkholderiales bacterium]|nr:hypothetical protein [Burkholderiales bacterium]
MAARTKSLQTSFTSGVLHPGLNARTDIDHYFQGARIGRNVLFVKEGGGRGRWGLEHIADVPANGRLAAFSFNTEQNYLLWLGAGQTRFFRDDALVTNINGTGNPYLVNSYTLTQCLELDYTQSVDTMVLTHQEEAPLTLVRGVDHNLWTAAAASLINLPKYDFADADSPTPTSHVVDITFTSFDVGNRYKLELNDDETPEIVYADSGTAAGRAANQRRIKEELLALPTTGFDEAGITVAWQATTVYRVTFSGDSADAFEPMSGRNTDKTSATITCATIASGVPRREDVISATRGWPAVVTFYESRLLFGAPASLPQSIIGTVIGGFNPFNFKMGDGLDDQGIFTTLNTNQVNEIRAMYPGRQLQVFTSGGEFYSPDRPITPSMSLPQQSSFGCAAHVPPVEVDGATIFVTRQQKTLREYLFLDREQAYNATSLTVLASHLFSGISSLDAQTSTTDDEQSYVIGVNEGGPPAGVTLRDGTVTDGYGEDGTATILSTLRSQDIAAWSEMRTRAGDKIRQVCVVGDEIYFLIERQRNISTVFTIEKATFETRMDAAKYVTTGLGTTVAGFDHLAGELVDVRVDGAPVEQQLVSSSGTLTFAIAPTSSVEAGYFVPPVLETMPLVVQFGGEALLGAKKRLSEIRVAVRNTLGLVIKGIGEEELAADKIPGTTMTATPDAPFTGLLKVPDLGWTEGDCTITLTQRQPLPFHVLALSGILHVGAA